MFFVNHLSEGFVSCASLWKSYYPILCCYSVFICKNALVPITQKVKQSSTRKRSQPAFIWEDLHPPAGSPRYNYNKLTEKWL